LDFFVGAGFLSAELVAGEAEDGEFFACEDEPLGSHQLLSLGFGVWIGLERKGMEWEGGKMGEGEWWGKGDDGGGDEPCFSLTDLYNFSNPSY
jgi:hypothetical protein